MEGTGYPIRDVVVRTSVINMRGEIVLDTLMKPYSTVTEQRKSIHGIS